MCAYKLPVDHLFSSEDEAISRLVSVFMVKALRPLPLSDIHEHVISKRIKISEQQVRSILQKYPNNFEICQDHVEIVRLITKINVCETHCKKNEKCSGNIPFCSGLHVCKYFILSGKCTFGGTCRYGHDLTTPHNMAVLREHLLDSITVPDFMMFMKQSRNQSEFAAPMICKFYNSKRGCNTANKTGNCPFLHLCRHYIQQSCKFGKKCFKSHDILSPSTKVILEKHGISTKREPKYILANLREVMSEVDDDSGMGSTSINEGFERQNIGMAVQETSRGNNRPSGQKCTDETDSICFYYLRGKCLYGNGCRNFHSDLLYHWRYRQEGTADWLNVSPEENTNMEFSYCDPENKEYFFPTDQGTTCKIQFKTTVNMNGVDDSGVSYEIQRLSTASSVQFEKQSLTTEWIWYWQDRKMKWTKYGDADMDYRSNITSSDLEQAYVRNPEGQMSFQTAGHRYILDLNKMTQQNLDYETKREVRRRPVFLRKQDIEERKKRRPGNHDDTTSRKRTGSVSHDELELAPLHWSRTEDLLDHCKIVEVQKKIPSTRKEYEEIENLFCESLPNTVSIVSIERIENGELYFNYASKKKRMEKKKKDIGERRLFHGTKSSYVDAICKQGFDFRLNGQSSGAVHGKGSYFATTAKFSHRYTDGKGICSMFVVKVMAGEYALGKRKFVRPPPKDESNLCSELYDSCVNDVNDPSIFVIFDNSGQVYPEYVIKYEYKY
ncbi:polymerase [Mactra antiquata]